MVAGQALHLRPGLEHDALAGQPQLLGQGAQGVELGPDLGVVALGGHQLGHRHSRHPLLGEGGHVTVRHRHGVGGVVRQGRGDDVGLGAQVARRPGGDEPGQGLEDLEVGARLPGRVDGRVEGVHEGVHVGRGDVVLLVPGGRRQDDVGVQGGGGVAEVRGPHEVELADGGLIAPRHRGRPLLGRGLDGVDVVVRAHHVAQEELRALGRAAQQVRAPRAQDAREVLGGVGVLAGEAQLTGAQLLDDVVLGVHARLGGLLAQEQRAAVEGRVGRRPPALHGLDHGVGRGLARQGAGPQRGGQALGGGGVVAPLVGGDVPEARGDHLPGRAVPVQGEGVLLEAAERADLLLTHVVGPAAAVDALGGAHGGQRQDRPVDLVGVVVVVDARAHDDLGAAAGLHGVESEVARHLDDGGAGNAGDLAGPGGSARDSGVLVVRGPLARHGRALDGVLGQEQVVDGGDQTVADTGDRHTAAHDAAAHRALGGGRTGQVEAGQEDLGGLDLGALAVQVQDAHDRVDALHEQVPLALALGGEAVGQGAPGVGRAALAVPHEGTELVLRGTGGDPVDVGGRYEAAGHVAGAVGGGLQADEEGGVGVAAHVVQEEGLLALDVELGEDDVSHRLGQGAVGTRGHAQPLVGELGVVGVVGGDGHDLLPVVAGLGHEVGVRGAGQRQVGAPHHEVLGVVPVAGLGDVGLVPEDLR